MIELIQTFHKVYTIQKNKKSIVDTRFCEISGLKAALVGIGVYTRILHVVTDIRSNTLKCI